MTKLKRTYLKIIFLSGSHPQFILGGMHLVQIVKMKFSGVKSVKRVNRLDIHATIFLLNIAHLSLTEGTVEVKVDPTGSFLGVENSGYCSYLGLQSYS